MRKRGNIRLVVTVSWLISTAAWAGERPNLLLIVVDDWAPGMTGFEGHPLIKTPNLDRLAAEGAYFTRCYSPTPEHGPSQASILTGQYPHTHELIADKDEEGNPIPLSPFVDAFSARLKEAGYTCGLVGNWPFPYDTTSSPGFGFTDCFATDARDAKWDGCPVWVEGTKYTAANFLTDWHADRAIEFVGKPREQAPFLLWLGFRAPGEPLTHPPGTEGLYPPDAMDPPATRGVTDKDRPGVVRSAEAVEAYKKKDEQALREDRSKYAAMITRVDENVGRLLDALDEMSLRETTAVVFASGNGYCLGDHGLYGTGPFFYDALARGPLLIRYPAMIPGGARIERVVSLVDLAPTLLELAGLRPPITIQGRSLLPLLKRPDTRRHADECFLEYTLPVPDKPDPKKPAAKKLYNARGVVTRQYKFVDYLNDTDLLFDLENDPQEMRNLAADPHYAAVVKVLQARIQHWREQTGDSLN